MSGSRQHRLTNYFKVVAFHQRLAQPGFEDSLCASQTSDRNLVRRSLVIGDKLLES